MQGTTADKWKTQTFWSVLLAGAPKGAGKTTLALSAPVPMVVVSCDLGRLSIPPGVDRSQVLVLPYHDLTRILGDQGTSHPQKDIYVKLLRDLAAIYRAVKGQQPVELDDKSTFPTPLTVVLDGVSRLNTMLVDGRCAMNNIEYPDDLDKAKRFGFWGKRLADILTVVQQFASLPCNVILTTWIDPKKDKEGNETGVWLPDVGGKMDLLTAGIVGAALFCYSRAGKFYVRTQSDGQYPWVGVRDRYDLKPEIDVTIAQGQPLPFERVFGGIKK
jgi:hypothetical protein